VTAIAIDATPAAVPEPTGVAIYIDRLVRGLARVAPEVRFLVCYRLSKLRRRRLLPAPGGGNARRALFDERLPRFFAPRADLFHGADIRLPARADVPLVATVHDLYSVTSPGFETARFAAKRSAQYAAAARCAAAIVTHSEHVARAVRRTYSLPDDRVSAVPLGVDEAYRPIEAAEAAPRLARLGVRAPYLLFVGLLSQRKNPIGAVRALARLREKGGPPLELVLAGRDHDALAGVRAEAARLGVADRVRALGYVAPADLPALYARARALVFLTLDEGFGLPAIEAMACGTPVVAARRGAVPEVAGGAALLVEPDDPEAAAEALLEVTADGAAREARIAAGRALAARYTWDETARRTLAVYRRVLGGGTP
jgi:glycosyltransferase involved in cell wall biosynthesis